MQCYTNFPRPVQRKAPGRSRKRLFSGRAFLFSALVNSIDSKQSRVLLAVEGMVTSVPVDFVAQQSHMAHRNLPSSLSSPQ